MSTTARRGVATSVQLSVGDGGEAVLSWSSDDDTATYVVLAGRFEVDGATGEPSTTPDAQGLLGEAGSIATGDDEVLRLTGRARSTAVQVDPTVITCFAVVLVTPEEGVPSPTKPCWPSAPPAGPEGVRLEPTPGTELATVTWRDRSNDEARFRVLGIRDQHGREEVVESVVVDADGERATVRLLPNTCYLVRAENAANALPDELAGSPRPDPAGASRDDACT